ncbi:KTSC domain-containing protein [Nitrobacter sp. NHB1]|uniref:KTSC domain-containing protein n=1 Tax=Nitrobacter sp. NHB1 TaxID=3119830 RepID=UPI003FA556C3
MPTAYSYCEMPRPTLNTFMSAPSMGKFYNANIKGSGKDGPYDCRTHRKPSY